MDQRHPVDTLLPTVRVFTDERVRVVTGLGIPGTVSHILGDAPRQAGVGFTGAPVGEGRRPAV